MNVVNLVRSNKNSKVTQKHIEEILIDLKGEIDSNIKRVGEFNTPFHQ
jgi:hypothetical protein